MVVANEGWAKHAASDPSSGRARSMSTRARGDADGVAAAAKAVFVCRPNSHPFENRTVPLDLPVKIGRAVQRSHAAPAAHNAIFDCKVLSRSHATLWYENGLFYLMDNKSSNGTFVNNHKLYESGEDNTNPYQVSSGDVVQFGVDVVENSEELKEPMTHGCIVATLKLYLPNGREAERRAEASAPLKGLYELNKYVQEAVQRESSLEARLTSLRGALDATRAAAAGGWRAAAGEQRLLARVRSLEARLEAARRAARGDDDDAQRQLDSRQRLEERAREALRMAHEERLAGEARLLAAQSALRGSRAELARAERAADASSDELQRLAERCAALDGDAAQAARDRRRLAEALLALRPHDRTAQAGNSENGFANSNIDNKEISSIIEKCIMGAMNDNEEGKNCSIIDGEERDDLNLTDSIRNLPEYVKAVLPDHILEKVGCKVPTSHMKNLQVKLFLLKNKLHYLEKDKPNKLINAELISNNLCVPASDKTKLELEEDGKESTEKDESSNSFLNDLNAEMQTNSSVSDSDISESDSLTTIISAQDTNANNNAIENNLTNNHEGEDQNEAVNQLTIHKMQMQALKDEIAKISKQIDVAADEEPTKNIYEVQGELLAAESQIQCLLDEVAALQQGLSRSLAENSKLRTSRDSLRSDNAELQILLLNKAECNETLEDGYEKIDEPTESTDLIAKLKMATEREAKSRSEIDDLQSKIYELNLELNDRISTSEAELLKERAAALEQLLQGKEKIIEDLEKRRCDSPDDNDDSSADNVTVLENGEPQSPDEAFSRSHSFVGHFAHADEELLKKQTETQGFNDLEEELVKTKERWASLLEEKEHLSRELKSMSDKYASLSGHSATNSLLYAAPIILAIFYYFFYQSIS